MLVLLTSCWCTVGASFLFPLFDCVYDKKHHHHHVLPPILTLITVCLISFDWQLDSMTPLGAASWKGHPAIVALLLKAKGIDVNKGVSIIILIPTSSLFPTYAYSYYIVFLLFLPISCLVYILCFLHLIPTSCCVTE